MNYLYRFLTSKNIKIFHSVILIHLSIVLIKKKKQNLGLKLL